MATLLPEGKQSFTNTAGAPLVGGKVYTYDAGTTNPRTTYQDAAGTTPNANPIILDARGEATIFWSGAYKVVLKDAADVTIWTVDNIVSADSYSSTLDTALRADLATKNNAAKGANMVGVQDTANNFPEVAAASRTVENVLAAIAARAYGANVLKYGADKTGATDSTAAFDAAEATGKIVYVPAGTYAINWTVDSKIVVVGDGSNITFIKPFNTATAAVTYTSQGPYWTYHSEFRGIGFQGTGKVGVGFTFSKTDPTQYAANDEYANNVHFYGCNFRGFNKGIQFPFGNIGTEFYSCNFQSNFYGVYTMNNKFGPAMHAGNKYFYAGEISANDCGVYCHNTQDGFGGLVFHNTIFEANGINTYIYTNNTYIPVIFDGCWNEQNGTLSGIATVTLDQWAGSVRSTTVFASRAHIFDGSSSLYNYNRGRVSDFYVKATNTRVVCDQCTVEYIAGVGAKPSTVDDANSMLILVNPMTNKGVPYGDGIVVEGAWKNRNGNTIDANVFNSASHTAYIPHRYNKQSEYGGMGNGAVLNLTAATNVGAGSFANILGTVVADGVIFPNCNEWTIPFTNSSQFMSLIGSSITTAAGYYVMTIDVKVTAGSPTFFLWDRSTVQAGSIAAPSLNKWQTIGVIAYSPGAQTFYFDIGATAASVTLRMSAFQIHRFDTLIEAEQFVKSMAYIAS